VVTKLAITIAHEIVEIRGVRKHSAISLLAKPGLKPSLYFRPFGIDDTEINRMPDAAACGDHVIAKGAFFARSDAENRGAGAVI
jgi:hypothetical protein